MSTNRILLVEDDPALATLFATALSDAGFTVSVAGDGLTAIEDIDETAPDLVILDLQLPQVDGATILRELAATPDTQHIPVVIVTGADTVATPASTPVLRKPCDPSQLVALARQYLTKAAA